MTALIIILSIFFLVAVILSLRLKIRIIFKDELSIKAGVGFIIFNIIPKKQQKIKLSDFTYRRFQKKLDKENKKALKKSQKEDKKKKTKELKEKLSAASEEKEESGMLDSVIDIIKFALEELPKLFSAIKTEISALKIIVCGKDAHDAAVKYGIFAQSVSYFLEILNQKTKKLSIPEKSVNVCCDFLGEKTTMELDVKFSLTVFSAIKTGLRALSFLIKQKINKNN